MKNFLRILFLIVILFLGIITIIRPAKTETNILRAVFSKNQNSDLIVTLSNKYSSKINIIIECNEAGDCETTNEKIFENIDKNIFKSESADIKPILDGYKKYSRNLLSDNSRKLLLNKDYETIKQQSFERLLNPLGVSLLPIEEDPFLLFTDYLMSLADGQNYQTSGLLNHDNKLYKIIPLTVNQDLALSPTVINTKIKTLINLQKTLTSANVKIYLINIIYNWSLLFLFQEFKTSNPGNDKSGPWYIYRLHCCFTSFRINTCFNLCFFYNIDRYMH